MGADPQGSKRPTAKGPRIQIQKQAVFRVSVDKEFIYFGSGVGRNSRVRGPYGMLRKKPAPRPSKSLHIGGPLGSAAYRPKPTESGVQGFLGRSMVP